MARARSCPFQGILMEFRSSGDKTLFVCVRSRFHQTRPHMPCHAMQWHQRLHMLHSGAARRTCREEQLHVGVVRRAGMRLFVLHQTLQGHHASVSNGWQGGSPTLPSSGDLCQRAINMCRCSEILKSGWAINKSSCFDLIILQTAQQDNGVFWSRVWPLNTWMGMP